MTEQGITEPPMSETEIPEQAAMGWDKRRRGASEQPRVRMRDVLPAIAAALALALANLAFGAVQPIDRIGPRSPVENVGIGGTRDSVEHGEDLPVQALRYLGSTLQDGARRGDHKLAVAKVLDRRLTNDEVFPRFARNEFVAAK